jgi:5-methylcytosine-specific restriction endonuclease McrA
MSTERWLTRYPHTGKLICRWCGDPVEPPRRSWCGQACVREWEIRTSAGAVRRYVKERDHGVCAQCGFDAEAARKRLYDAAWEDRVANGFVDYATHWLAEERWKPQFPRFHAVADEIGLPMRRRDIGRSLWEADHIVPVAEGGGCCGLENYRTLCWKCHAGETKALAGRRAKARRPQLELPEVPQ